MDTSQFADSSRPPCTLSEQEKNTRRNFVREFVKDYNPFKACIRIGYTALFAGEFSKRFMEEPFVLQLIAEAEGGTAEGEEFDEEKEKIRIYKALWREANSMTNPAPARVAALAKLTSIMGMDAPTKSQIDVNSESGGVFVVPGIMNEAQWAAQAAQQQAELVKPTAPAQLKAV